MNEKEVVKKKSKKKKYNPIAIILVRLLICIIIFASCVGVGYYFLNKMMEPEEGIETVPGVIGNDQVTARKLIESKRI